MMKRKLHYFFQPIVLLVLVFNLLSCEKAPGKAAPIGDHAVLEQLADAYRKIGQEYPVSPSGMRPAGKKEFVQRVFQKAGYDYAETLKAFAKQGVDVTSQDQRDLAELLLFPSRDLASADWKDVYMSEELAAVKVINAGLQ
jgi:hypothetical protein